MIKDEKVVGIKVCKKWAESDIVSFKKYITYYVSKIDSSSFRKSFLERVNYINKNRGLPLIQEWI